MEPLAYLISWTAYGTWLHGDARGSVEAGTPGVQPADAKRQAEELGRMTQTALVFTEEQRRVIELTVRDHCRIRGWTLHAVNPRSNHIHVVVTASTSPEVVMSQLKAWCARRLSESMGLIAKPGKNGRRRWWTEHGSTKWINDENYLQNAIRYVNERQ